MDLGIENRIPTFRSCFPSAFSIKFVLCKVLCVLPWRLACQELCLWASRLGDHTPPPVEVTPALQFYV